MLYPYVIGKTAYYDNAPREKNPYNKETDEYSWECWDEGWTDARNEELDCKE